MLISLQSLGYVEERRGCTFHLSSRGRAFLASRTAESTAARRRAHLAESVRRAGHVLAPHLRQLSADLGEVSWLGVLCGHEVRCVVTSRSAEAMARGLRPVGVGAASPAASSAAGRVLLASMQDDAVERLLRAHPVAPRTASSLCGVDDVAAAVALARTRGYCVVEEEVEAGLVTVAVPVTTGRGRIAGAIEVGLHAGRHSLESLEQRIVAPLVGAAAVAGAQLAS